MSWEIVELETTRMLIQINFESPLMISYELADEVVITFADSDLFITEVGI